MDLNDVTPTSEDQETSDGPFRPGETLTRDRAEAVLTAAARELHSGRSRALHGWMSAAVVRWLIGLADALGAAGSEVSDETTGALALANVVLRMRDGDDPAYRAGREDAASALARARANFTASPEAAFPLKLDGRQYLSRGMAVDIARGASSLGRSARGEEHNTERGSE